MSLPILVWILLSAIWGTTWLAIKLGLETLPPFTFAGIRFMLASAPLLALLALRRERVRATASDWRLIVWTGFLTFSLSYGLVFWGERHISSGLTAIFFSTFPLFGLIIAHFKLPEERMTWRKTAGVIVGIAGVALVYSDQFKVVDRGAIWGSAAVIASSLSNAYVGVLIKSRASHIDPLVLTCGQMVTGFIPLLGLGLLLEGNPLAHEWNLTALLALLYLALIGSALAFVLVYWLMQRMEVTKTQLMILASTLIAVLLGKVVLQERLGWRLVVGGAGILLGLAASIWGHRTRDNRRAGGK